MIKTGKYSLTSTSQSYNHDSYVKKHWHN